MMKNRPPIDYRFRDLASEVLDPYSRNFLIQSGIREGMHVLEIGCGAGSMTAWLSQKVGSQGRVVALDINPEQIERARQRAVKSALNNIEFLVASVDDIRMTDRNFDFIYGRFILMQLQHPFETLERLITYLRPGGIIALDEPNQEADLSVPPCPPCARANRIFLEFADRAGIDFRIGDQLYPMLMRLDMRICVAHVCQPIIPMGLAIQMFKHGLLDSESPLLEGGVVSGKSFAAILDELAEWKVNDRDYYALSRQVQVSATRI